MHALRTMIWLLGALATLGALGCDGGRTGPGVNGTPPVGDAASFSFSHPVVYENQGPGFDRLVADVTIGNRTERTIVQAYVSLTGAAKATGAPLLGEGETIGPGGSHDKRVSLTVNATEERNVEAVLVAVVLDDGTVYGDGGVTPEAREIAAARGVGPDEVDLWPSEMLHSFSPGVMAAFPAETRARIEERIAREAAGPAPGGSGGETGSETGRETGGASGGASVSPCAVALWGPGDLELVRAEYGAGETVVDVTDALRAWLGGDASATPLRIDPGSFGIADPALGVRKTLTLTLAVAGEEVRWRGQDGAPIVLGAPADPGGPVGTLSGPIDVGDMRILAAWYGAGDGWADAMPRLRSQLDNGQIRLRVGAGLGDPKPNVVKSLRVYFERSGERLVAEFPERERVTLPLAGG